MALAENKAHYPKHHAPFLHTSALPLPPLLLYSTPVVAADKARERERKWFGMIANWDVWIGPKKFKVGRAAGRRVSVVV